MTQSINDAATREQLEGLWQDLLTAFIQYLDDTPPERRRASMLSVIMKFLKDNHVSIASIRKTGVDRALKDLEAKGGLPFPKAKQ